MVVSARELLDAVREQLAPGESENRLVPLIEQGQASRSVFATIAAEENLVVSSDWRSFLTLAGRSEERNAREFFSVLAQGEGIALRRLAALGRETGLNEHDPRQYRPLAGCQAYPAYLCWLALNAEPAEAIVAVVANFAAWAEYCATISRAMRAQYGFSDEACGFFDFFATPDPSSAEQALTAVRAAIDSGACDERAAHTYGRLFQSYELMFWNTLAERGSGH